MPSLTRGPLPARVYWRRRLLLLVVAVLLVFGLARLLGSGSDASSEPEARPAAAEASVTPTLAPTVTPDAGLTASPGGQQTSEAPVLVAPDGPCEAEDIVVTPQVKDAVAGPGAGARIRLHLQTRQSEACTWHVSSRSLSLKITSGHDDIWSSRQCPRLVPDEQVVVRRDVPASVVLTWNGRRSDDGCPRQTDWALPGFYHVVVAALAGEPTEDQFELRAPSAPVITRTPEPHQSGKHHASDSAEPDASQSATAG